MKHRTALAGVCFAIALILVGGLMMIVHKKSVSEQNDAYRTEFFAMDTLCDITLWGDADMSEYRMLIERMGKELDRYDEDSEVYRFNTSSGVTLTGNAAELYEGSKELYEQYGLADMTCGGLISLWGITSDSPRVPTDGEIKAELEKIGYDKMQQNGMTIHSPVGAKLDFGCVAKGYALDKVNEHLKENGVSCAVVSMGSSTLLYGHKPGGELFKTGIKDPFEPNKLMLTVLSESCFVSTSGGYERYFEADGKRYIHILDLATGRPCESGLASVTVMCQSGLKSDFLSTAIFIDGKDGLDKYLDDESIQVIAIDNDGKIYYSPSLEGKIELSGEESGGN